MTRSEILARIRSYVLENFLYARSDVELGDDEHLFERGIVDSLGVAELVVFLEEEFTIEVADEDVTEHNFCSLAAISNYVFTKQPAARP